jgi:hypothetical protein
MTLRHEQLGFNATDNQFIHEAPQPSSYEEEQEHTRRRLAEERLRLRTTYVPNVGYIALDIEKPLSSQTDTA